LAQNQNNVSGFFFVFCIFCCFWSFAFFFLFNFIL